MTITIIWLICGNAIVPQVAAEFIKAALEVRVQEI